MKTASVNIPYPSPKFVKLALMTSLFLPLPIIAWKFFSIPSANPAQELNHLFGRVGFYALAINMNLGSLLAIFRILKKRWPRPLVPVVPYRRHLGVAGVLFLVVHVCLHFLIEGGIDEGFKAIAEAKYLWLGALGFLGLFILAITSNNASMKKLGKRWKTLHRAVYPLFFIACAHTLMIEKADLQHFGLIAAITGVPLLARILRFSLGHRVAQDAAP